MFSGNLNISDSENFGLFFPNKNLKLNKMNTGDNQKRRNYMKEIQINMKLAAYEIDT